MSFSKSFPSLREYHTPLNGSDNQPWAIGVKGFDEGGGYC
jgi:hypothetical protein